MSKAFLYVVDNEDGYLSAGVEGSFEGMLDTAESFWVRLGEQQQNRLLGTGSVTVFDGEEVEMRITEVTADLERDGWVRFSPIQVNYIAKLVRADIEYNTKAWRDYEPIMAVSVLEKLGENYVQSDD